MKWSIKAVLRIASMELSTTLMLLEPLKRLLETFIQSILKLNLR
ncbi:Uncharacterized protein GNX_4374 [Leptospira interrogans serovar Canicola]|nr:Uncharacterized protein GNX_4374 [Leptospira interrogans serovar Canicola]